MERERSRARALAHASELVSEYAAAVPRVYLRLSPTVAPLDSGATAAAFWYLFLDWACACLKNRQLMFICFGEGG